MEYKGFRMSRFERILIAVFFTGLLVAVTAPDPPKVCIDDGCLIGITETSRSNRTFFSFLGVPYAKAPVGELRFKSPQAPDPWDTLNATKNGNICTQSVYLQTVIGSAGDEDCLYLNVYTHQIGNSTDLRPVIVWIHPGGFIFLSATSDFFGGNYLLDRDVVVVAPNYRLNVFGFLSTEDEDCPGNWGLKDQTFALQWIQKNIAKFGGDPNKVTLMGQSAGAISTHLHMLSPLSKGLFHRAIAQSGSALSPYALTCTSGNSYKHAVSLGRHFGCSTQNSSNLVECLRGRTTKELLDADVIFTTWYDQPSVPHKPTIECEHEGAFLVASALELIEGGHFNDVPLMTGIVQQEGTIKSGEFVSNQTLLDDMEANINTAFPAMLLYDDAPCREKPLITKKMRDFYFGNSCFTTDDIAPMTTMFSDSALNYPFVKAVELQKDKQTSPIFAYRFEFLGNITLANLLKYPERDYNGTAHCDDLIYLFPVELTFVPGYVHTAKENAMVDRMLDLWTNFATNGTPTYPGYDINWLEVKDDIQYLATRGPNDLPMITEKLYPERMAFWRSLDLETDICPNANPYRYNCPTHYD